MYPDAQRRGSTGERLGLLDLLDQPGLDHIVVDQCCGGSLHLRQVGPVAQTPIGGQLSFLLRQIRIVEPVTAPRPAAKPLFQLDFVRPARPDQQHEVAGLGTAAGRLRVQERRHHRLLEARDREMH